ncbi:MAG: pseudouridine synthase [Proteobacteria bacterium]|jgi:23S rRNA pseudouridine2605 synthase|nr:pseudouridine synthase [Pseudomonadota bacterium]MDA1082912.1 pseudouridine synthase [Pseudomonadota bacterium]MDA9146357.1 rRNA pseudouridine synthase [Gammaproteobacteria bacterium]
MLERLQKFLAQAGIGSRRGCENFIKEGRVTVNGKVAKLGTKVSNEDLVEFDNKAIELKEVDIKVIALNKPEGVLSSTAREKKIPIVYDYLPNSANQRNWISIGRLDINTSGLMLFTNDGGFANYCMHPSNTIDREYLVRARGNFSIEKKNEMLKGIIIDGEKHQFTDVVEGEKIGSNQWFSVCLVSGKNREVRKIFQSLDLEVSRLKRTRFGPIFLPSTLKKGKTIELTHKEISELKNYGK